MRALAALAAVVALALPAAALGAKPVRTYTGQSSTGTSVGFKLSAGYVRGFAIGYEAECDDGETLRGTFRFKPAKVTDGRWSVNGPGSGKLPDGRTTASKLRLSGELGRAPGQGRVLDHHPDGQARGDGVATCRSGRVTWKASQALADQDLRAHGNAAEQVDHLGHAHADAAV